MFVVTNVPKARLDVDGQLSRQGVRIVNELPADPDHVSKRVMWVLSTDVVLTATLSRRKELLAPMSVSFRNERGHVTIFEDGSNSASLFSVWKWGDRPRMDIVAGAVMTKAETSVQQRWIDSDTRMGFFVRSPWLAGIERVPALAARDFRMGLIIVQPDASEAALREACYAILEFGSME